MKFFFWGGGVKCGNKVKNIASKQKDCFTVGTVDIPSGSNEKN